MKMFGKDGKLHEVPDHQVQAAFLSGNFGFLPGTTVPVVTQEGQVGGVKAEEAQAAFSSGARVARQEEYEKAAREREYGGLKGMGVAAAEGAARGVTVGLSDPLAIETARAFGGEQAAESTRKHLESYKETNPGSAIAGEVAGVVAPALFSGGAAAGVEGAEAAGAVEAGAAEAGAAEAGAVRAAELRPRVNVTPFTEHPALPPRSAPAEGFFEEPRALPQPTGLGPYTQHINVTATPIEPRALPQSTALGLPRDVADAVFEESPASVPGAHPYAGARQYPYVEATATPFSEPTPPMPEPTPPLALLGPGTKTPVEAVQSVAAESQAAATAAGKAPDEAMLRQAARAFNSVNASISRAGELAEHAVAAAIGQESERTIVRVAQKALARGADYATQGALYNVGNQISEDALGDHETTAEKLFAAAGHGAMTGFLLGGALGATGELARTGLAKVSPGLQSLAESQAVRALNPKLGNVTEITHTLPGGVKGLGRWLLDHGVVQAGDRVDDVAGRVGVATKEAAARLDAILGTLDQHATEFPEVAEVMRRLQREALNPLAKKIGFESIYNSVEALVNSFQEKALEEASNGKVGFLWLRDARATIDDLLYRESNAVAKSPRDQELRQVRQILEDELEKYADKASRKLGDGTLLEDYQRAKVDFRYARTAEKISQKETDRLMGVRVGSPTDYLAFVGGLASGGGLKGAAFGAAHHVIRERGNATVAAVLDKVANFSAMSRAVKDINGRLENGVAQYLRGESPTIKGKLRPYRGEAGETMRETYERKVQEITRASQQVSRQASAVKRAAQSLVSHAPNVAKGLAAKATAATAFLASKVPKQADVGYSVQPQFEHTRVSDADASRFLRYAQAVENPMSVLDEMHRGTLSREHVEALRSVYPKIYEQLVNRIQASVHEADKPLPYDRLMQLSLLFGTPVHATQRTAFVQTMQQTFKSGAGKAPGPAAPKRPIKGIAEEMQMGLTQAMNRRR